MRKSSSGPAVSCLTRDRNSSGVCSGYPALTDLCGCAVAPLLVQHAGVGRWLILTFAPADSCSGQPARRALRGGSRLEAADALIWCTSIAGICSLGAVCVERDPERRV